MTASTRFGDAMRLLAYRDFFPDFGVALTMLGFAPEPDHREVSVDTTVPVAEVSDEDEHVYTEPVDGWVSSQNERWATEPEYQVGTGVYPTGEVNIEGLDILGEDWQLASSPPRSPDINRGDGRSRTRPPMRDTREEPRFVIAHVLSPTFSEESRPTPFTYRSVPVRRRPRGTFDWPRRPNEIAWRLAVECLSTTSPEPGRRSIDIAACVIAMARSEAIERIPMRERGMRRAPADTVLCDIALTGGPAGADVAAFLASIQANSKSKIEVLGFNQTVEALGCGEGPVWSWRPFNMSTMGQRVIAVTSIPPTAHRRYESWRRLAESMNATGRRFAVVNVGEVNIAASGNWPCQWFTLVC